MDYRREDRATSVHDVSVWSLDQDKILVQNGVTLDVSPSGACVTGLHRVMDTGEIVGIQNGSRRGRFKVVWRESNGSRSGNQVGIERLESDKDGATRVLYADESQESIEARRPVLQAFGYECKIVAPTVAIVEELQREECDLLILAHPLQRLDTSELLITVRRSASRVKIVLLSAHPQANESLRSLVDAFVYAREPHSRLIAAVERALDGRQPKLITTRTYSRHAVKVPFMIEVLRSGVITRFHGTSEDLSERGIGGKLKSQLIPGEMVKVTFPIPNAPADISAHALVRHRRQDFYGFEFISIDDQSLRIIRNLCAVLPTLRVPGK